MTLGIDRRSDALRARLKTSELLHFHAPSLKGLQVHQVWALAVVGVFGGCQRREAEGYAFCGRLHLRLRGEAHGGQQRHAF